MTTVFISGTDTGVGKTLVSSYLAAFIAKKGYTSIVQKWVQTGSSDTPPDINLALKLLNISDDNLRTILPYVMPYSFSYPSSPHLAAQIENTQIKLERILHTLDYLEKQYDYITIEGSGGLMVPLRHDYLFIDLIKKLSLPVVLVIKNKLGAINHTLLSIEALRMRKIHIIGLIFNNFAPDEDETILKDNVKIIAHISRINVLGEIPYLRSFSTMPSLFEPIGEKIMQILSSS